MNLKDFLYSFNSIILAQGGDVATTVERTGLTESQRKSLVIGGIFFVAVMSMFAMIALFTRRRRHRKHRRHERSHERPIREEQISTSSDSPDSSQSADSGERSHRHRRRRSRSGDKYKMNPTLSETGGLPPVRPDDQVPKY